MALRIQKYVRKVTRLRASTSSALRRGKARVEKRSLAIVIPADIARELGIRERQKLVLRRSGKKIIIEDWKP